MILDKALTPFEKAVKILTIAYETTGMVAPPDWLIEKQIEITGLQESMVDNKEAVLVAFETMIIDKFRLLKGINELTSEGFKDATTRFKYLVQHELIPFANILKTKRGAETDNTVINSGILTELYNYGISKTQLPTLKALSDYMGAKCRYSSNKWVIDVSTEQLDAYFATPIDDHDDDDDSNRSNSRNSDNV
jgi:hypothetical protein